MNVMLTSISNERRMSKAVLPTNQDYSDHVMYLCIKYPCTRQNAGILLFLNTKQPLQKRNVFKFIV